MSFVKMVYIWIYLFFCCLEKSLLIRIYIYIGMVFVILVFISNGNSNGIVNNIIINSIEFKVEVN